MRRITTLILSVFACAFFACSMGVNALAADGGENVNSVKITVVMPEPTAQTEPQAEPEQEPEPTPTPAPKAVNKVYPSDVTETNIGGGRQIVKTYELAAYENPADIPREDFERGSWTFTLTDIIRRETANAETRPHAETVTLNTDTKDLEKILPQLAQTMEYKSEDEFVGVLTLDVASIKVEAAGTKTTSYEMKVTREYPRLSAQDTSLVPKTVSENGKTYTLAGVDWRAGNYTTVDYEQVAEYYTAVATYTATGSSTKVTGYVVTAVYNGTLAKLSQGKTVYTAYFEGTEIRTPLEMTSVEQTSTTNGGQSVIVTDNAVNTAVGGAPNEPATGEDGGGSIGTAQTATGGAQAEPAEQPTATPIGAVEPSETAEAATEQPVETSSAESAGEVVTATAEPAAPDKDGGNSNAALYAIIAILAALLGGAVYFMIRKGIVHNEKTTDSGVRAGSDGGDDDSDGDTDLRG